ncbi:HAD family hydrolase [Nocardioides sp.]|jgi:HAD superfamily hydrolase (TIGR01549 family)|uniref:HAD family hydrolase n=1 Tax=Nocardioides sp. TaxID=35761 RepID=UPI002C534CAD|nr:HAD family hydrolase [Nocardioides sp.]HVX54338.1 HAD family hydrolase [Nocardioides sp.]
MIRAQVALLDIDGTLLDSTYHHALAWARAFAEVGHPVPVWRLHRRIGMGGDRIVTEILGAELAEEVGEEVSSRWEAAYDEVIGATRLLPGARELLDGLRAAGLEVVLASSSIPKHAEHALRLLVADDRADAWTTAEDAAESKPHPELLEAALDRTRGDRAVMIGDATWDAIAAARVGVPTIGLRCGGFGEAELRAAGAVAVYDDPADLLAHLDEALVRSS